MPDMTNVKDSLYEYPLLQSKYFESQYPDGYTLEHALDGGRQLTCGICNEVKSYSGSSQKLIAEAFSECGWYAQEGMAFGLALCHKCYAGCLRSERDRAETLAEACQPTKEGKPKYDYGCSIVHLYPGSMALNKSQNGHTSEGSKYPDGSYMIEYDPESPITFSGVDPFTYEAIYIHANGYERRLSQETLDGKWYIYPKNNPLKDSP